MNSLYAFSARSANASSSLAALILMACLALSACGTKPKNLKTEEPFPAGYPQAETPVPAAPPPTK